MMSTKRIKFIFDLDGTITACESLPFIAKHFNIEEKIEELTKQAVLGEVSFKENFKKRVSFLRNFSVFEINTLLKGIPLLPKILNFIHENKEDCLIATSNLSCWIEKLSIRIGCECFSSECEVFKDKVVQIKKLLDKERICKDYQERGYLTVFIGDGNNDVQAMSVSDISIASAIVHTPSKEVIDTADHLIYTEDALCELLTYIKSKGFNMQKIDKNLLVKDSEIVLPLGYVFTVEEKSAIHDKNIKVKYKDEQGKMYILSENTSGKQTAIHALRSKSNSSSFSESDFNNFPKVKAKTAFNAKEEIFKGSIQIKFRAELDETIALVLLYLKSSLNSSTAQIWLNGIHSILRNILSASCRHTVLVPFEIAGLSADVIHSYSHNPLKHIGYDHIIPSAELSRESLEVNVLRTKIRSLEVTAYSVYFEEGENGEKEICTRPDILYTLNRLSSVAYVLMHLIEKEERNKMTK